MAQRRMFAKSIITSARFLTMPQSSRLLYYDLGMHADDDGVVEAFGVMRMTGANDDDLRVLIAKNFITLLNDEFTAYITDWNTNNVIRKDRYQPSQYHKLLVGIGINCMSDISTDNQLTTNRQPNDNQEVDGWETQYRLGKDSIGKDRLGKEKRESVQSADKPRRARFVPPTVDEVAEYCAERENSIDPAAFVDYYTANGWKQGAGKPLKDWKAAVRTWERREKDKMQRTNTARPWENHLHDDAYYELGAQIWNSSD